MFYFYCFMHFHNSRLQQWISFASFPHAATIFYCSSESNNGTIFIEECDVEYAYYRFVYFKFRTMKLSVLDIGLPKFFKSLA